MPVFFIQPNNVGDGVVTITDPLLSHIAKSLRTKPGESLIFNQDQGPRYHTIVDQVTKHTLHATVQQVEPPPPVNRPPLILAQALLKGEKMGWIIQKATELGITTIIPLITERVIIKLSGKQGETHQTRWKRIALEAAQQSERWNVPNILPLQSFQKFLNDSQTRQHLFLVERDEGRSLLTIPVSTDKSGEPITVIIGPEGGWSEREIEAARSQEYLFASFGKEILRAETASLAALAILQARLNS